MYTVGVRSSVCKQSSAMVQRRLKTKTMKKGPVYMMAKPWLPYFKEKVDHDGVPIEQPDESPIGNKLRPARSTPQF